jgi:hypothetical protein
MRLLRSLFLTVIFAIAALAAVSHAVAAAAAARPAPAPGAAPAAATSALPPLLFIDPKEGATLPVGLGRTVELILTHSFDVNAGAAVTLFPLVTHVGSSECIAAASRSPSCVDSDSGVEYSGMQDGMRNYQGSVVNTQLTYKFFVPTHAKLGHVKVDLQQISAANESEQLQQQQQQQQALQVQTTPTRVYFLEVMKRAPPKRDVDQVFTNPVSGSTVAVRPETRIALLLNHSFSVGPSSGFEMLVTHLGGQVCQNYTAQIVSNFTAPVCSDGAGLDYYGAQDGNYDPSVFQAQFRYEFTLGAAFTASNITIQTFQVWRGPSNDSATFVLNLVTVAAAGFEARGGPNAAKYPYPLAQPQPQPPLFPFHPSMSRAHLSEDSAIDGDTAHLPRASFRKRIREARQSAERAIAQGAHGQLQAAAHTVRRERLARLVHTNKRSESSLKRITRHDN